MRAFHALTPETQTSCLYFWSTLNGFRPQDPLARLAVFNEVASAFKEDQRMVEAQQARLSELGEESSINIVSTALEFTCAVFCSECTHPRDTRRLTRLACHEGVRCFLDNGHDAIVLLI